jgi:Flp pilus assembly secretin CpaC
MTVLRQLLIAITIAFSVSAAFADTRLTLISGGKRTIRLNRPATRIENLTPETVSVEQSDKGRVLTLRAHQPGNGRFTVVSKTDRGESKRDFTIQIGAARSAQAKPTAAASTQSNLRQALPTSVKPVFLGDTAVLTGPEVGLADLKRILSLVGRSGYTFVPQYKIRKTESLSVVTWINERLSGTDAEVRHGAQNSELILRSGTSQLPAGFTTNELTQILPNLIIVADSSGGSPVMVNIMFHFVESAQSAAATQGMETTGIHSPLRLSLDLSGVESAPLETYLQYLNQIARTRIVEQPSILLRSGRRGSLFTGGELALSYRKDDESGTRFHPFGLKATVEPLALQNGEIDVVMDLEFSEPVLSAADAASTQFNSRRVQTDLRLKDGLSKLIARVNSVHESEETGGLPLLSELPLLNLIFGKEQNSGHKRELMLFITGRSSLFQPLGETPQPPPEATGEPG